MPETYMDHELDSGRDEPKSITRRCSTVSGCGEEFEVTVHPDDTYDGGHYFGTVTRIEDSAELVGEHVVEDEWVGRLPRTDWSDTREVEFWRCAECRSDIDYDPGEADRKV